MLRKIKEWLVPDEVLQVLAGSVGTTDAWFGPDASEVPSVDEVRDALAEAFQISPEYLSATAETNERAVHEVATLDV